MLDKIPSNQHNDPKSIANSHRVKPNQPPRNDQFRKTYKEGRPPQKEDEQSAIEEKEVDSPPSLFDLSKNRAKNKPSLSKPSTLKNASDLHSDQSFITKRDAKGQEVEAFSFEEDPDTSLQNPTDKTLFAAADKPLPLEKNPIDPKHQSILFQQSKTKKSTEGSLFETKESESTSKKEKSKGGASSRISEDQDKTEAVLSTRNQPVHFATDKAPEFREIESRATIQELANQIIERIQVMRREDLNSTIITLRHPPILEGSTITLTTSDNAKREFNISFANLSPDAKMFLDRKLQEQPLTETLERKGIIVHMITTTTQVENFANLQPGQSFRDQQEQQRQQQQEQQRRQQNQEEDTPQ